MSLIKQGMSINCRTEEEIDVFYKVAMAEGHRWGSGTALDKLRHNVPISYQIGYFGKNTYPNDVTYCDDMNFIGEHERKNTMIVVEAADLFRNQLISRRLKNGTN